MQKYSAFGGLVRSFYSTDFYRDVGRNWRGIGLKLLLLVVILTWVIEGAKVYYGFNQFAQNDFPKFIKDFPPITITDGVVSSPVPQPYAMKDPQSGKTWAVLDTTGEIDSLEKTDATVLLTKTLIYYRDENRAGDIRGQDLSGVKNFSIDRAKMTSWMNQAPKWFAFLVVPLLIVFTLIYCLIYAAIGLIWNNVFNANLPFSALMRLSSVAVTPSILISTLLFMLGINLPALGTITFAISMTYLIFAVKANGQQQPLMNGPSGQNYFQAVPPSPYNPPPT